ncbi:MAG: 16S rRNA (cytidine(1402)-2'-O)-methyltransferase [Lachnospiraceae bacterium]|nr:16S rRNA (cytidine(1402)-2'-O)-methyltransferase [Lachnospiraceae bacterium]
MPGTLYLCATPIGNLEDITLRALRILKEVDLIAAEDTRTSGNLLRHFDIHTPLTSYHKFNEREKGQELVERLLSGTNVALVTDAGTPAISDPGETLVRLCIENHVPVTSLPGANACITALTLSGRSTRRFVFEGFLPTDKKERREVLRQMKTEPRTIVLYEAPHRLAKTLQILAETLGEARGITLCRELTKRFETITVTTIGEAIAAAAETDPRGEYVLVLDGKPDAETEAERQTEFAEISIADHVASFEAQGMPRKEAMRAVAAARGISRRDVYQALL